MKAVLEALGEKAIMFCILSASNVLGLMNPMIFNCFLLFVFVILLSIFQSRFRVVKDSPLSFVVIVIVVPFLVLGKAKNIKSWDDLTGLEIFTYTLMLAYLFPKRIVPKLNEGFIYAYTLLHWYLVIDAINRVGYNFWNVAIALLSIFPTILIIKNAFEDKALERKEKIVLYYWFLFIVGYCFISQWAQNIIHPVLTSYEISYQSTFLIFISAVQLYFISTILTLWFVAIPAFHLDKGSEPFKVRWQQAKRSWRKILNCELDNYIEYQINRIQVFYITVTSVFIFFLDYSYQSFRPYLIIVYTIVLPLIYFYLKVVPEENLEDPFAIPEMDTLQGKPSNNGYKINS